MNLFKDFCITDLVKWQWKGVWFRGLLGGSRDRVCRYRGKGSNLSQHRNPLCCARTVLCLAAVMKIGGQGPTAA